MATLFLTLLFHFAGLTAPEQNPAPTTATYSASAASQADGGAGDSLDR